MSEGRGFGVGLLLVVILAVCFRLPYWEVIPASFDEVGQTSYAFRIGRDGFFPLVANDNYSGPYYVYFLALLIRLGVTNPMMGRVIALVLGVLTVLVSYQLAFRLSGRRGLGVLVGLLVAVNPDLILVNSRYGGITFLLPFFVVGFLLCVVSAERSLSSLSSSLKWIVGSGVMGGLALQSNPLAGLVVAVALLWLLVAFFRNRERVRRWWLTPVLVGSLVVVVYAPVIFHNLANGFETVDTLGERSYLWQTDPTIGSTLSNLRRLLLQWGRQMSGVVLGDESVSALVGLPLFYCFLAVVGGVVMARRVSILPVLIFLPFLILLPVFSSHYGYGTVGRFTTMLIPIWLIFIAMGADFFYQRLMGWSQPASRVWLGLIGIIFVGYPLWSMNSYFAYINESALSGRELLTLSRHVVEQSSGEAVFLSSIPSMDFLTGFPYVPHAAFLLGDVYHEFLPADQIVGKVYQNPAPTFFMLSDADRVAVEAVVPLEEVDLVENEQAMERGFGLYFYRGDSALVKPDFVFDDAFVLPPNLMGGGELGGVRLLGCSQPEVVLEQGFLNLDCFFEVTEQMPEGVYISFLHLFDPVDSGLIGQDDHVLGREKYPLNAWQEDEIIMEQFRVAISAESLMPASETDIHLLLGIYQWPDQQRLAVEDSPDNVITVGTLDFIGEEESNR